MTIPTNATPACRRHARGMTLIELTAIILVLLTLTTILFVGTRAWKQGSDRTGCIMNIRTVQVAVRSYANLNGLTPGGGAGEPFLIAASEFDLPFFPGSLEGIILGDEGFLGSTPLCPAGGEYEFFPLGVPDFGTLALYCSLTESNDHIPENYEGW